MAIFVANIAKMEIRENFNIRKYNTFDIDVTCRYFVESDKEEDFLEFVSTYELDLSELIILGGGSNFLFTENFEGTIFYPTMQGITCDREDDEYVYVRVGAGVEWDDFVCWSVKQGYGGIENLSFIPGHVGAAPVQNVGAYGVEAKDTIFQVEAIDIEKAQKRIISNEECDFAYRNSIFKGAWKNRFIITYVLFKLAKQPKLRLHYGGVSEKLEQFGGKITLATVRQAIIDIRREKLPSVEEFPNAGSFFKNPIVDIAVAHRLQEQYPLIPVYPISDTQAKLAAGWLIDQVGWKGRRWKQAGVHTKQALVLVNLGGATGEQIAQLANEIKKSVFIKFGVFIEPEVYVI